MGATGPKCNFFLQICNEVPGQKNSTGGPAPLGRPGLAPLYKHSTPIPSSFEPKNSTKNPEKNRGGEEKESGEALPDSALVICRLVHLVYVFFYSYCRVI